MATRHLLDPEGAVVCTATSENVTSVPSRVTCTDCIAAVTRCVGCFDWVRPGVPTDHAPGCPTGQNGTPNYE